MIALERRHAALAADELLGGAVELARRHARAGALAQQRERARDDRAGGRHALELAARLAQDHDGPSDAHGGHELGLDLRRARARRRSSTTGVPSAR